MREPPDRLIPQDQPLFSLDRTKQLTNTSNGPKYLLMSRINGNETLTNVSPFLIKKVIDGTCGEVEICKKIRNGNILIKTKNNTQAAKLITLTSLSPEIKVNVSEHSYLNHSKGVIYTNDLRGIEESEILQELKPQNVIEIRKIMKKVNNELKETGLIIVTIASVTLPESLFIGYERVKLRPYVPFPMRCRNCLRFGHPTKACTSKRLCPHCALEYHNKEDDNTCNNPVTCSNCIINNIENNKHNSLDKACPVFLKEKEIQTIVTLEKMERKKAVETYNQRHQSGSSTYSSVIKSSVNKNISTDHAKTDSNNLKPREIINYDYELPSSSNTLNSHLNPKAKTVTLLPRNTSNRTLQTLKRKTTKSNIKGKQKQPKAKNDKDDETSDSMSMENE